MFLRSILVEYADDKTARLKEKKKRSCMLQLRSGMVKHLKNKREKKIPG